MATTALLVSTNEFESKLQSPDWVIFDCRHDLMDAGKGERAYRAGHIPGARFANVDTDLSSEKNGTNGRHPLPSPVGFAAFLARNGVGADSTVVAYDDVGGQYAARLWWLCRWIGLKNVGLLDGGFQKWSAEGRAVTTDIPAPKHTALRAEPNPRMVISAGELLPRLNQSDWCVIDARAAERYRGDVEPIDPVAGHIPSARNHPCKQNLAADLTFKPDEELRAQFVSLCGDVPTENVIHQCGSGVTACLNAFAMEHAGLSGSKLYAGSWSEWIADPSRPVAR
jgi:thiosulfate/3-mercaptopyruvate sulfurtransferase